MDCHSKLVLHSLRNNQPVQIIVHQPRQTTLLFPSPSLIFPGLLILGLRGWSFLLVRPHKVN